ncbi:hypothetical protein [Paraoerskovia sediminicola]|nr:hypothetical protein [Paraoerskovia sediminicola]
MFTPRGTRPHGRAGRTAALARAPRSALVRALVAGLLALLTCAAHLALSGPAAAHGGELQVDIGTDGAGGIDAVVVWAGDEHPVEETVDLVVSAVSDDGEEVGPIQLQSASEGVGWYRSEPGILGEGHWTLTTTATEPEEYEGVTEIDVVPAPTPEPVAAEAGPETEVPADDAAADEGSAGAEASGSSDDSGTSAPLVWGGAVLLAVVAAVAVVIVVRRRAAHQD